MDVISIIRDKMMKENLLFVFRGEVTEKNSLPLLTLLENEMNDDGKQFAGRKRLFMYVLESLQNIVKHGDRQYHNRMPIVSYSKEEDGYKVTTGNIIASEHVENLKSRLEKINKLDIIEAKDLYRDILSNSGFSDKGGAGLGLIEMAVKTGTGLDYDFVPDNKGFSYFILSKTVDSNGMGVHSRFGGKPFKSDDVVNLEYLMAERKIYMMWSGHITSDVGEEVLSLAENRLNDKDVESEVRRRVFNIMVEMLENVSKYNPGREQEEKFGMPLALVRFEKGRFLLTTGNLILNSKKIELVNKLSRINSYNKEELKESFYGSLSKQAIDTDSTGDMGLISMARKSGSKLDFQFKNVNDLYSYFLLTVGVDNSV
jgi:hypothetical protein